MFNTVILLVLVCLYSTNIEQVYLPLFTLSGDRQSL